MGVISDETFRGYKFEKAVKAPYIGRIFKILKAFDENSKGLELTGFIDESFKTDVIIIFSMYTGLCLHFAEMANNPGFYECIVKFQNTGFRYYNISKNWINVPYQAR